MLTTNDPGELCKYGYDRQAKRESESHGSHLNPNPRTNKQLNIPGWGGRVPLSNEGPENEL